MKIICNKSGLVFNKKANLNINISDLTWHQTAINGAGNEVNSDTKVTSSTLNLKAGIGIRVTYNTSKYIIAYLMQDIFGEKFTNKDILENSGILPYNAQQSSTRLQVRKKDGSNITVSEITDLNLKLTYISVEPISIMLDAYNDYNYVKNLNLKKGKKYRFETTDLNSIIYLSTLGEISESTQLTDDNKKKVFEGNGTSTATVVTMDKDYNSAKIYSAINTNGVIKIREVEL